MKTTVLLGLAMLAPLAAAQGPKGVPGVASIHLPSPFIEFPRAQRPVHLPSGQAMTPPGQARRAQTHPDTPPGRAMTPPSANGFTKKSESIPLCK